MAAGRSFKEFVRYLVTGTFKCKRCHDKKTGREDSHPVYR